MSEQPQKDVTAVNELFLRGITTMTEGLPAFINCTASFLVNDYPTLLPRDQWWRRFWKRCCPTRRKCRRAGV